MVVIWGEEVKQLVVNITTKMFLALQIHLHNWGSMGIQWVEMSFATR